MSGGIDSTYCVSELKKSGYEVIGAVLKMHDFTDVAGAKKYAALLDIPLREVDCREKFDERVKSYFALEYSKGRTPNPCAICNREVKFELLLAEADALGCDFVATGHYAGVHECGGRYYVTRGSDAKKDQSYMLWKLSQEQLSRVIFPLEKLKKDDIRRALGETLPETAHLGESEDICFLPDSTPLEFVESVYGKSREGDFIDKNGNFLGKHKGIPNYTVGQRRGLGVAAGHRIFVTKINPDDNTITLGEDGDLLSCTMTVSELNFQKCAMSDGDTACLSVKVRYAAKPVKADVTICGNKAEVAFSSPARAVAPGQSAVFYDDDGIVFGGIIE